MYPGSRGPFSKYLGRNKPCSRFTNYIRKNDLWNADNEYDARKLNVKESKIGRWDSQRIWLDSCNFYPILDQIRRFSFLWCWTDRKFDALLKYCVPVTTLIYADIREKHTSCNSIPRVGTDSKWESSSTRIKNVSSCKITTNIKPNPSLF